MSVEFEFSKAGRDFVSRRLDPFKQGAVLKRVVPLIGPMIPLMLAATAENLSARDALKALEEYAPALSAGIATLKDDDLNFLIETCLQTLKIRDEASGQFMPFWNKGARQSMFADMNDLSIWLPLTIEVIKENLAPFFRTTVTGQLAATTPTPTA